MTAPILVVAPGDGALMRGGSHQLKAGVDDTAGAVTAWVSRTAFRKGPPLHLHEREDELFYVLAGRYELTCGAERVSAEAGCLFFLPRLTPHVFRSVSEEVPGMLLHFCVPGGLELYFAAIGDSDAATDEGRELRRAAGDRFGLRFPEDPEARLPGAERQPPFLALDAPGDRRVGKRGWEIVPRLAGGSTAGRIALCELSVAPGAAWRAPVTSDWSVAYLLAGELELGRSTAAKRCEAATTLIVPPGADCSGTGGGGRVAHLVVVSVPPPRG